MSSGLSSEARAELNSAAIDLKARASESSGDIFKTGIYTLGERVVNTLTESLRKLWSALLSIEHGKKNSTS
jgi:hypothetical protein